MNSKHQQYIYSKHKIIY